MLSREFPTRRDLSALSEVRALRALQLLRQMVANDRACVYTAAGTSQDEFPRWNVWINEHVIPGGRRVLLTEWAANVTQEDDDVTQADIQDWDGGDCA